jgi:hypothetical protein
MSKTYNFTSTGGLEQSLKRSIGIVLILALLDASCLLGQQLNAQAFDSAYRYPPRIQWSNYDPYYVISNRVYAQAALIRAQGDAAVSYALSRNLHAEAYSKELDNWEKELRVYWDRKITAEKKKLELGDIQQVKRMRYLNDNKWKNSRTWDQFRNHPELAESRIRNGDAHNFLLARLAGSALQYQFDPDSSRFGSDAIEQLKLDESWLGHIRIKQGAFVFPANESVQENISVWPYVLRWKEFESARSSFEEARAAVIDDSKDDGQASVATIERLEQALLKLARDFHISDNVKQWVKKKHRYTHFLASDRFLRDLDHEIIRLERTGDIRPFQDRAGYDPKVDGDHVVSLLCFMNRNGLEFAEPKPGSEFAYHNLFVMMRALYLTVAEEDPSLQPKNLSSEVER